MTDPFSEHRINLKFCVKLEKNANDTWADAYGGEAMKTQVFLSGKNSSKRVHMSKS
jgi:hypothetical protein